MNIIYNYINIMLIKINRSFLIFILFFILFLPRLSFSQTACTNVFWSSGHCTICSGSQYSCNPPYSGSGNWNNGIRNFADPIPGGNNMTSVTVTVYKVNCGYGNLCVYINGVLLQCKPPSPGGYNCWCGSCWPEAYTFSGALPGYNYGGTNSVQLTISGGSNEQAVCVSSANICFNYAPSCVQSGAPSSASASPNPTCGGSTTLFVSGGSLGTGAQWFWYSGACGGSFVGNGSSINVSPGSTTTYYVRAQGNCNTTACASVTVSVNSASVAPSSASASPNPLCGGGSTTLTVSGGSLGTGASWNWFSGSCGGTFVNSGSSINVSPTSNTTYFVRAQGTCNTTACAQVTVTSGAISIAPSSITASPNPICGGSTLLTQNGGSLGLGASYLWYANACGGGLIGTGPSISVSPSSTTTYYVLASGTCNTTGCASVTVTVNSAPSVTASVSTQTICSGGVTSVTLSGSLPGTSFTWTFAQSGVSGAAAGSGPIISQQLTTSGNTTGTVVYIVTPSANGCIGNPINVTVVVNPVPIATANPSTQTICSGGTTSINLTSNVSVTSFNWTVTQFGAALAAPSSGATIAQTIIATGPTPGTVVYLVTPTTATCTGSTVSVTVTVIPNPIATAVPSTQTICSGEASSIALTSTVSGTVFNWTAAASGVTGSSNGSGSPIAQTLLTTGPSTGTVTYTITPSNGTCLGIPILVTLTVNPKPVVTASPTSQTLCTGGTTAISLSSSVGGTTFAWTVVETGVSGASPGNGANINQTLSATGNSSGTAVYTITPTVSSTGCLGTPIVITITVNPLPVVTANPVSQTICSGSTTGISLTSNVSGATFAWTISQNNVTGGSPNNGSNISQLLTTTGSTAGTAVYTITPTAANCVGSPISVIVNVDRTPVLTANTNSPTICSGDQTAITLASDIPGSTFAWTVSQTGVSGASPGNGNSITQTLIATGITAGTVSYTIVPTSGNCLGLPVTLTITVNPKPVVTASPASQAICSGTTTSIALSSNVVGTTFSWTFNQTGVSGAISDNGTNIAQTLTLTGPTAGSVVYTVTPITSNGCSGTAITIVVTVNKADNPTFNYANSTYCQTGPNAIPSITGLAGGTFSASPAGLVFANINSGEINLLASALNTYAITYLTNGPCPTTKTVNVSIITFPIATFSYAPLPFCQYASNISPIFASGASAGVFTASPAGLVFVNPATGIIDLTLSTPGAYTVTNTIVPGPCPGAIASFSINITTAPIVTPSLAAQYICSGSATSISFSSSIPGSTFAWTVVETGVSGASPSNGVSITQTLITTGNVSGTAVYTVIPTAPGGCAGQPVTVTIIVNPVMVITATPSLDTICSGDVTSILLSSNVVGTFFSWTVSEIGVTGASNASGAIIAQSITTTGAIPGTATYTITPSANNCTGAAIVVTITVNPIPVLTVSPAAQTICSGASTSIALTSSVLGTTFNWTFNQSNVSGASDGNGSSITQALTATGTSAGLVTYIITPKANGCFGAPITLTITVNPRPVITANPPSAAFCSFGSTSIALTSNVIGTTYSWTVIQSGVTGGAPGFGPSIIQSLSTTGTVAGTAVYVITPTANNCTGSLIYDTIYVSPIPVVTASPVSQTFCSGDTTSISLTSNVLGTVFSWTVVPTGVAGAAAGTDSNINQILTATGITNGTAAYTITPLSGGGCQGSPISVTITVKPRPVLTVIPSPLTICSGDTTYIAIISNIPGTTFTWTANSSAVTGAFPNSGNTIEQGLTATGTNPGSVIYTITPTFNLCTGNNFIDTVSVNPRPVVTATPALDTICSLDTTAIALSSNLSGTTFPWTVFQTNVSGGIASSGSTISQMLTNTNFFLLPGTAIYTVTPIADGCAGSPLNITIVVKKTDNATYAYTSGTYCQSAPNPTPIITGLPGGVFTSSPPGLSLNATTGQIITSTSGLATYNLCYTTNGPCPKANCIDMTITIAPSAVISYAGSPYCQFSNSNPSPVFGVGASAGIFSATPAGLVFVHVNSGEIDLMLSAPGTYIVTNTIPAGGTCITEIANFTITINPGPTVTANSLNPTICSGDSTSIILTSTMPGTTYNWTIVQTGVAGGSDGFGTSPISQVLATTSIFSGTAVYIITPTAGGCTGLPIVVTVTINSYPSATAIPSAQVICSGQAPIIVLTSNISGTTFAWTASSTGATGATANNGLIISEALTATDTVAGTVVYTVTPTFGGCVGAPIIVTITVNPTATAIATPSVKTICSGDSTLIALTSNIYGTTFSWTVAQSGATGASDGNGNSINQFLTATFGTVPGTVTYTVTPSANGCDGLPIIVTVTVNPNPEVTISPSSQTVCSGTATSIALTSNITGTTFSWTVVQTSVTGAAPGNGQNIVQNLTATDSLGGTAVYTIVPTVNGCIGIPKTLTITVKPKPVVTASPSSQTICSGNNTGISLTSNVAGTSFSWTVSQNNVTGAVPGINTIISQTLTATLPGTALYIITPEAAGCQGSPISVTVTVKPSLVATALPSNKTICSGDAILILLTSNISGTTFSWIANQTGVAGATDASNDTIAQTLTATGSTAGSVTYTITPVSGSCSGLPIIVSIVVNPTPIITAQPSSQTICSGATTNILLSSTVPATSFTWTALQTDIAGAYAGAGAIISQTITTINNVPGTAIYTITPSSNGCSGIPINDTVNVKLLDDADFTYASATFCLSGADPSPTITGLPGGTFLSTTPPFSLSVSPTTGMIDLSASALGIYTLSYTTNGDCPNTSSINVTITNTNPSAEFSYLGSPFCQYGTNPTPIYGTGASAGTYTAIPAGLEFMHVNTGEIDLTLSAAGTYIITNTIPISGSCLGATDTTTITISGAPTATATPTSQTICSGELSSILLSSSMPGTTYAWTAVETDVSGAYDSSNDTISQLLTTTGLIPGSVLYTIIPTAGSCPGLPLVVTIIVNPGHIETAIPSTQIICSGESTSILLTSNVNGTVFNWTVIESGTTGASSGTGAIIAQTLTATGTLSGTAIYSVSQIVNGCLGIPLTVTVTVNPAPVVTASPMAQTICSGDTASIALSSTVASVTYAWTASLLGVTGAADGNGDTISHILTATSTTAGVVTYIITPTAPGDCLGQPITVTVTVNPDVIVTATPMAQVKCSGEATAVVLNSNIPGSTFSWTVNQTNVTGATADTGNFINQTLTATDSIAGSAIYTVTPMDTATNCPGSPIDIAITIKPIPVIKATPAAQTICTGSTTSILLSSNVLGTSFMWTVIQTGVTGAAAGSGASILQTLSVAGGASTGTAVYQISSVGGGCTGNTITLTITVNTLDSTAFSYSSPTFCQSGIDPIAIIAGLPGGVFSTNSGSLVILDSLTGLIDLSASSIGLHTVKYTSSGQCSDTSMTFISITSAPLIGFTYTDTSYCKNEINPLPLLDTLAITGVFSATPAGLVFTDSLTGEINLAASAEGTYTITNYLAPNGGCGADSSKKIITITNLIVTATPANQAICSGSTTSIPLTSSMPGTTYSWTVIETGISGASPGNDSLISQTLTLTGSIEGTAVYIITPSAGGCIGDTIMLTITVKPAPFVIATPSSQTICSDSATLIVLTSNFPGTIFSWIANQTGVTGAISGTDTIISQTLSTTGTNTGTAVYTITPSSSGCPGIPTDVTITVNQADDASFTYPSATYCQSGIDPIPSIIGLAGGTFTSSPAGLVIDAATGIIDLSASILNTYVLTYTSNGVNCPNSSSITMTIGNTDPSASFGYVGAPFCQNGNNPLPTYGIGASAGVFTSSPSGLVFEHINTGEIDLSLSLPGTYVVINNIPASGSCNAATASTTVIITLADESSFVYSSATYCQSGIDPTPSITGVLGGTFYSNQVGLSINGSTGIIDLSASILGQYTLCYYTNASCPDTSCILMTITNNNPSSSFDYMDSIYCQNGTNPFPLYGSGSSAGFYSASPAGLEFAHVNTGEIDLISSLPGTYVITNNILQSGTCLSSSSETTITIAPSDDASFYYTSGTYCQLGTNPTPFITGLSGGIFSSTPIGLSIDTISGTIILSNSSIGNYQLTYTTNGTCQNSNEIIMTITDTTPTTNFSYPASPFCASGNNPFPTYVAGASAGIYSSSPTGIVFSNFNTGEIDLSESTPGTYIITNMIPASGSCLSSIATDTIVINLLADASFSYTSATYCQSGTAPSPIITGVPGGVFSSIPFGLSINSSTGAINLAASLLGEYQLTYSTLGSCENSSSITMVITDTTPTTDFNYLDSSLCINGIDPMPNFIGNASAGVFTSTPAGLSFVNINTGQINLALSLPGNYTITNTIPISGTCLADSASSNVIISASPVIAATPSSLTICTGSSTSILLSSSITNTNFNWVVNMAGVSGGTTGSTSNINQQLTTTGASQGTATYIISSDANGCGGSTLIVPVTVNPTPMGGTVSMQIISANCHDTAGSILGIGIPAGQNPLTYIWTNSLGDTVSAGSSELVNVIPGSYSLTLSDSNGCTSVLGPFVVTKTSDVSAAFTVSPITGQTPLTVNFTNNSINATNYLWDFGTIDTSTQVNPVYSVVPTGTFTICLIAYNAFACADTACSDVEVDLNSLFIIPNVFTPNDDNINDLFQVNAVGLKTLNAEIFNRWGEKIAEWHTIDGGWDGRTASGIAAGSGTYFYIIDASGKDGKKYFEKGTFLLIRNSKSN